MAKMKKKTMAGLLIAATVIAGASSVAIIDSKTGFIPDLFEEENFVEYSYYNNLFDFSDTLFAEKKLTTKLKCSEGSPFESIIFKMDFYTDDGGGIDFYSDEVYEFYYFSNVSRLDVTFKLKQNVDFYINYLSTRMSFLDEPFKLIHDNLIDNDLKPILKVDNHTFDLVDSCENDMFFSDKPYSGDVNITIINKKALTGEGSRFLIDGFSFNNSDLTAYNY